MVWCGVVCLLNTKEQKTCTRVLPVEAGVVSVNMSTIVGKTTSGVAPRWCVCPLSSPQPSCGLGAGAGAGAGAEAAAVEDEEQPNASSAAFLLVACGDCDGRSRTLRSAAGGGLTKPTLDVSL